MESYWPHAHKDSEATGSMIKFANKFNVMPKIVFSKTLQNTGWENTRLIRDNAIEEVGRLKQQPGKDLSIGGISICQDFIKHGLIDEYLLLVQPFIWGKGRCMFDILDNKIDLKLTEMKKFKSGVVVLRYLTKSFKG